MIYDRFKIHATPHIADAYCECKVKLHEVSNGLLSTAMYCPKCESVYLLKLVKLAKKKVTSEFLKQCKQEIYLQQNNG